MEYTTPASKTALITIVVTPATIPELVLRPIAESKARQREPAGLEISDGKIAHIGTT